MGAKVRQLRLVVEAPDYEQAVEFYRDALGLEEQAAYEGPDGAHVTILEVGRATLELANPAQHRYIDQVEVGRPVAGPVRVALEVGDAAEVTQRLVGAGADLVAVPTRTPWGSLNARLDAPAGLHLTLFEELPDPVLRPAYPIETDRLLLRPIDPVADLDAMLGYLSRKDVCRWIPPEPLTRAQLVDRLGNPAWGRAELRVAGDVLRLGVVLKETGRLVGDVILGWHSAAHRQGEIGYVIHPEVHGQGFATEAARAVLGLAFDGPWTTEPLRRVTARIDADNTASGAVLRKIGMRQEAVRVENEWFKGRWSTEIDYAILDREWRALFPNRG